MKTISRYIMTLALLLTAVTGAWAQSSLNVVELEVPAAWASDNSNITAGDLPGFKASTYAEAKTWTGAPAGGMAVLIYAFDGNKICYVLFSNGKAGGESKTTFTKKAFFDQKSSGKFYYTVEPTEWSLTPDADKKVWTLAKMPASNIELQVEYFAESNIFLGKDALADKANIAVKNGETTVEFGDDGKSTTTVTEGNTVTAKFTGKKVLGMKVEKKAAAPASTLLDNTTTAWTAGTFAVPAGGLTYSDAITVSGDVTLVLTDGETLTLNKGISLASGATLTIEGNGTMNVNGTNNNTSSTVAGTGTLVLTSGTLNAKGGNGQGVGDRSANTDVRANAGGTAINGNVTVSGGTLTATGGNGGGVGGNSGHSYGAVGGVAISGSVTVTGGTVTATGGNGGGVGTRSVDASGGAGGAAIGGDATISGGTWTASNGTHGTDNVGHGGDGGKAVAGTVTDNR